MVKLQILINPNSNKRIHLIGTKKSPVLVVLNFHSSEHGRLTIILFWFNIEQPLLHSACIMNFVTNSAAYSFYPFSTYCRKTSLICGINEGPTISTIEKYQKHGWSPEFAYTDHELMTNATPSECKKNVRWIGDANCWVHHDTTQEFTPYEESIEWSIQYFRHYMEIADNGEVMAIGYYYPITHREREM